MSIETIDFIGVITVALLGSLGHCVGMCGGFVVAYSSAKVDEQWSRVHQLSTHLLYNFGRVTTYIFLGIIFGSIGTIFTISPFSKSILFLIIAIFMILMGISLMGKLNFLNSIEFSIEQNSLFKRYFAKLIHSKSYLSFYLLGVLNGFIPCGFVYFFIASAISTTSPLWGGVVMLVFGISTIPVLLSMGFFISYLKSGNFRDLMIKLASFTIIFYGLYIGFKSFVVLSSLN